jgi:two-component system sensor kinase FixL
LRSIGVTSLGVSAMSRETAQAGRLADDLAHALAQLAALQSQNAQLSRLTAMERIGMNLAHELAQPLAAVVNYVRAAQQLAAKLPADDVARLEVALEGAMAQSLHAGRIVNGLREFVSRGTTHKRVEVVSCLVQQAVSLTMLEAERQSIRVSIAFDPRAGLVLVDRVQIEQVLGNLIRNAVQAMADSARRVLRIATRRVDGAVEISITDSGQGLPDSVRSRLFEPFVTTRPDGTGLGLAICRAIVEAHGGALGWRPAPDGGTTFHFTVAAAVKALP